MRQIVAKRRGANTEITSDSCEMKGRRPIGLRPFFIYAHDGGKVGIMKYFHQLHYPDEGDGAPVPNAGDNGNAEKTFTQAELDTILKDRLKRANTATTEKLLADLGVGSPDELKTALSELGQLKAAAMSEGEKAAAELQKLRSDLQAVRAEQLATQQAAQRLKVETAVLLAAIGFNDPQDAVRFTDLDKLEIGEDGKVVGVDEALKALGEQKPYLLKSQQARTPGTFTRSLAKTIAPPAPNGKRERPVVKF